MRLLLEALLSWLAHCFADVPDPRTGNATRHDFLEVLTIALTASVCGAESCVDFADFAADREPLFRSFLKLSNGLPSHDTFSRLFRLIDPKAFGTAFSLFVDRLGETGAGVLAIDGKTLRRSFDRAAGGSPLHVVSAFATERRLVLGQAAVAPGSNEIMAARELLALLDLTGMLVTGDAIHCQNQTAALITDKGGDWLFALKANRPVLHDAVRAFFADPPPELAPPYVTTDADHGRLEVRRHRVWHDPAWLFSDRRYPDEPRLPGLKTLALVMAEGRARRRHHRQPARLRRLRRPVRRGLRPGGARALGHREQPALGARRDLRRGPRPQPRGPRPRKPRHPAKTRPQPAAIGQARTLHPTQTQALRLVRRLRPHHPRPNAIAV